MPTPSTTRALSRAVSAALVASLCALCAPGSTGAQGIPALGSQQNRIQIPPGVDVDQILRQMGTAQTRPTTATPKRATAPESAAETRRTVTMGATATPREDFEKYAAWLLREGELDAQKRQLLEAKAAELGLPPDEALELAKKITEKREQLDEFFLAQVKGLGRDGKLQEEAHRFLLRRGMDLGLGESRARDMIQHAVERVQRQTLYRSIVETFLADGVLDSEETEHLETRREELELTAEEADDLLREEQKRREARPLDVLAEIREKDRAQEAPEPKLELYGRALFDADPSAFAPAPGLAPPDSYRVGPGDEFLVTLWGRLEAEYPLLVDAEGTVQFPKIGPVRVGGLTYAQARERLKSRAEAITGVSAAVQLFNLRSVQVFVVGEVRRPGATLLTPLSTSIHAVMAAGGPTPLGSLRDVTLRRGGKALVQLDLYRFLQDGELPGDRPLENGDVVVVPKAARTVELRGEVKRPAIYELAESEGLRSLVDLAGGLSADAYGGRVQVLRSKGRQERVALDVELAKLEGDFPLQDGDRVRVFALPQEVANEISVYGHVTQPGRYAYRTGMRVSDLLGGAGKLQPDVDLSYAALTREGGADRSRTLLPLDLGKALEGPGTDADPVLAPRDALYVFAKDRFQLPLRAAVTGEVREPGVYQVQKGATVADLVRLAGGLRPEALSRRAELLRYLGDRVRKTIYVDLSLALAGDRQNNLTLENEDELVVHPVWDAHPQQIVLIEGEIRGAQDDRFPRGQSAQQRFSELFPPPPKVEPTEIAGLKAPKVVEEEEEEPVEGAVEIPLTHGMTVRDLVFKAGGLTKDAYLGVAHLYRTDPATKNVTIHTFNLGEALQAEPAEDLMLEDLDHVVIHSAYQFVPIRRVSVSGQVNRPDQYPHATNMHVRDLVLAAGGLRDKAYLPEAEVVRLDVVVGEQVQTRTIRFSLAKAMAGDPDHNLLLEPYDKLFVKTVPDWREDRNVVLQGEVVFPGTYYIAKGERLSSVLRRAGGFTDEAYLRGAVFTRESAREQQQRRLNELRDRLEQAVLRASSEEVQSAINVEDVEAQKQFIASQQALIKKLEDSRATGRVVIQIARLDDLVGSEWDVVLEAGDKLSVPQRPQTVAVVGQVYNPTSLIWEPNNPTVEHYLNKTGGPTPDAEADEIYVVRADGTVVSSGSVSGGNWWAKGIDDLKMFPGDTVLVPEKILRINYMREIRDITQILYQIAVTAGVAVALF